MFRNEPVTLSTTISSAAAQKYIPSINAMATLSSRPRHPTSGSNGQSSNPAQSQHHRIGSIVSQQAQIAALDPVNGTQSWVLFGVQGARRTLAPAQILINGQSTDHSFFQELRKCYHTNRGRVRLWFSIWRLDFCEVVKFNRLTVEHMVREHRDLPTDQDYLYNPRAGNEHAKNPPFSSHLFNALFYTCQQPCTWPIPHDCMPQPTRVVHIQRIPKRTRCFQGDQSSPIWGLEAKFAISFAYILMYHCVILAGPFVFFAIWLRYHPDNLQDASVPVTIVLGSLSLFWSGSGILTSRSSD
ncbi:hypothetical protein BJX68DRAFT_259827 [Aspergillus pseudodeflectus]|uniref:Uncharacterized protein n=1 Tax=Aspergillus pseudodeflectus TaxID=176178 RepID=A0ABR4J9F7_9EURO